MPMTIYKLYAATAGDSVASIDIQLDGEIKSILMTGEASGVDAVNEGFTAEVSFLSSNGFTTNDTRGSLMTIQSRMGLSTNGGLQTAVNMGVSNLDVPVNAGERVHLHITDLGTITVRNVHAYLYVQDKGTQRIPSRRR